MKNQALDLIGKKFGRLTVVSRASNTKEGRARWNCTCECGGIRIVISNHLIRGSTKSCGCLQKERASICNKKLILPGTRYSRLVVLKEHGRDKGQRVMYLCQCDCGNQTVVMGSSLLRGHTKSCSCLSREKAVKRFYKDGFTKSPFYNGWYKRYKKEKDGLWTSQMELLLRETQKACAICGKTISLTVDHVNPVSKGYGLIPGNAVILCASCNSSKNDKDLDELPKIKRDAIINAAIGFRSIWDEFSAAKIIAKDL